MPVATMMRRTVLGAVLAMGLAGAALAQGADDLSGTYQVQGQNPGSGQGTYGADITVKMVVPMWGALEVRLGVRAFMAFKFPGSKFKS